VKRVEQVRREHDATGRIGFMRYRLTLINDDLLELTECVEVQIGEIMVTKYRASITASATFGRSA
jgi:hypothetical protein